MVTAARGVVIVTLELTNCCTHISVDEYLSRGHKDVCIDNSYCLLQSGSYIPLVFIYTKPLAGEICQHWSEQPINDQPIYLWTECGCVQGRTVSTTMLHHWPTGQCDMSAQRLWSMSQLLIVAIEHTATLKLVCHCADVYAHLIIIIITPTISNGP